MSRTQIRMHHLAASSFRRKHPTITYLLLRTANLRFRANHPHAFDTKYTEILDAIGLDILVWGHDTRNTPRVAQRFFRASLAEKRRNLPADHWMVVQSVVYFAQTMGVSGEVHLAEELLRNVVRLWEGKGEDGMGGEKGRGMRMGLQCQRRREVVWMLGRLVEEEGRYVVAGDLYLRCYLGAKEAVGEMHVETREYLRDCARALKLLGEEVGKESEW